MDSRRIVSLLRELPETELEILKMTQELRNPDGSVNLAELMADPIRLEYARTELEKYDRGVKKLRERIERRTR